MSLTYLMHVLVQIQITGSKRAATVTTTGTAAVVLAIEELPST